VTVSAAASLSSCCKRGTPKTRAALPAATSTHADATILTIETGVITTTRRLTDRHKIMVHFAPILFAHQVSQNLLSVSGVD
jgi:hypothetical protein